MEWSNPPQPSGLYTGYTKIHAEGETTFDCPSYSRWDGQEAIFFYPISLGFSPLIGFPLACVSISPSCLREVMVRVRINPYPNPNHNQSEESHSNQSEARITDLSCKNIYQGQEEGHTAYQPGGVEIISQTSCSDPQEQEGEEVT